MSTNRFSLRAILFGFFADIVASQIFVFALTLIFVAQTFGGAPQNIAPAQMTQLLSNLQSVPAFFVPVTALGLLGSVIGGYVAAFLSTRGEAWNSADAWRNALAAGAMSLAFSALSLLEPTKMPPWMIAIALALSLPATALGAFLCVSGRGEKQGAPPTDSP